jgi:hypothetical protein
VRVNRGVSCCDCLVYYVGTVQDQILSGDHVKPETGENRDRGLPIEPLGGQRTDSTPLVADPNVHSEDEVPDASLPKRDIDDRA